MIPRSFHWLALLLAAFTMLSVSVESCVAAKVVIEEDQPHALVSPDDPQALGKAAWTTIVPDFVCEDLPRLLIKKHDTCRSEGLPLTTAMLHAPAGLRRHRWLCMERC